MAPLMQFWCFESFPLSELPDPVKADPSRSSPDIPATTSAIPPDPPVPPDPPDVCSSPRLSDLLSLPQSSASSSAPPAEHVSSLLPVSFTNVSSVPLMFACVELEFVDMDGVHGGGTIISAIVSLSVTYLPLAIAAISSPQMRFQDLELGYPLLDTISASGVGVTSLRRRDLVPSHNLIVALHLRTSPGSSDVTWISSVLHPLVVPKKAYSSTTSRIAFPLLPCSSSSSSVISPLQDPPALTLCFIQVSTSSSSLFRIEIIGDWKTLTLMSSSMLSTLPIISVLIALVRSLTVICSLLPSLALVVDFMKPALPDLWQFGVSCLNISNLLVFLDDFSYMELVSLPNFPLGLSGAITGSWSRKSSATSVCVGSLALCFVTREFNADFMIVKPALVAFSISGLGLRKLSYIAQGTSSLLHTIVVELLLFGYGGLSVTLALIPVVFIFIPALCDAVYLASLALLSFAWNNFSSNGE